MIFRKKTDPMRETIYILYRLKSSIGRLEALMDRIDSRRKKLLEQAIHLEELGEGFLARKYASEAVKLENIYKRLADVKLVFEKITTSLEYTLSMNKYYEVSRELSEIVELVKKLPETNIPEVYGVISELEIYVQEINDSRYGLDLNTDFEPASDGEINRVLSEAKEIVKSKLELDKIH